MNSIVGPGGGARALSRIIKPITGVGEQTDFFGNLARDSHAHET